MNAPIAVAEDFRDDSASPCGSVIVDADADHDPAIVDADADHDPASSRVPVVVQPFVTMVRACR
jgi:hypothetical protein